MGDTPLKGVVDHTGEVFNYKNLYVIDGAIVPEALGVNPSRTIGALAERAAEILCAQGR
jgi:cholesterol oxidase